jgi:hypothetical protein
MHSLKSSGWLCRGAVLAVLAGGMPLSSLSAQIRRPDPVPGGGPRASGRARLPKRRTEMLFTGGSIGLSKDNATASSAISGSVGFRRQMSIEWLSLGGVVDFGSTKVDGQYFPYEKRADGDSLFFVAVNGNAGIVSARFTANAMTSIDEAEKTRAGISLSGGMYGALPSPSGGSKAGTFIAPVVGASIEGQRDLTSRLGVTASVGLLQFFGFDRDKIRPSSSALEDAVFVTPFGTPPVAKKSFGGLRLMAGFTYRLGVQKPRSAK